MLHLRPWAMAALVSAGACQPAAAQVPIEVATIPGGIRVPFQSHNQKVVQNDYGIFATRGDRTSVPGHFWLNRSTDGGRTFTTVYDEAYSVNPPTLETDEDHNHDGVKNGIEYFMGQSGNGFTARPVPDATRKVSWTKGAGYTGT